MIKINRAVKASQVGRYPRKCAEMLERMPVSLIRRLSARDIAAVLDYAAGQYDMGHSAGVRDQAQ